MYKRQHETVTAEELGGASTHASKSGVAHFTAPDEMDALDQLRRLVGYMPNNCEERAPVLPYEPGDESRPALNTILPENPNQPYDIRDVLNAVIDPDSSMEVHAEYARNMVIGFARVAGETVGCVANQPSAVSYTHLRAHETVLDLVCRLLLEKKKKTSVYILSEQANTPPHYRP